MRTILSYQFSQFCIFFLQVNWTQLKYASWIWSILAWYRPHLMYTWNNLKTNSNSLKITCEYYMTFYLIITVLTFIFEGEQNLFGTVCTLPAPGTSWRFLKGDFHLGRIFKLCSFAKVDFKKVQNHKII